MPSHTIANTSSGVTLTGAGYYNPVTVAVGVYVSGPQSGVYSLTDWTLFNEGTVAGTAAAGVLLEQGGYVVNGSSGGSVAAALISGPEAVYIKGAIGTVVNYGTLAGKYDAVLLDHGGTVINGLSGTSGAQVTGGTGIFVTTGAGAAGTVLNDGTIIGTFSGGDGALLGSGGRVTNGAAAPTTSTALISGGQYGVYIKAGGTITNYGTLQGTQGYGARVDGGGTIVNGVSGTTSALITGNGGVQGNLAALGVTNYGTINGTNDGVALNNGGSIDNAQASASIIGGNGGVDIFGGGSVHNLGTIVGTTLHGVYLFDGGNVTNGQSAASISNALISGGYYGIRIGFHNAASGTVTNFGTVAGLGKYDAVLIDGIGSVAGPSLTMSAARRPTAPISTAALPVLTLSSIISP